MATTVKLESDNPYATGRVIKYADGSMELEREPIVYKGHPEDEYHTIKHGDTIDGIAWQYYGKFVTNSSRLWYIIGDVNEIELGLNLADLIGEEILIPNIEFVNLLK